jgi:hypothetical protein
MWHTEHTVFTTSEPEAIWRRWLDVAAWPEWDEALESASINVPLAVGSLCTIRHRAWGTQTLRVSEVQEGKGFTCALHGFLSDIRILHRCEPSEMGSRLTQRVEAQGFLAWWLRFTLGRQLRESLPKAVRKLARISAR